MEDTHKPMTAQERVKWALDEVYDLASDLSRLATDPEKRICSKATVLILAQEIADSVSFITNEIHNGWIKIEDARTDEDIRFKIKDDDCTLPPTGPSIILCDRKVEK